MSSLTAFIDLAPAIGLAAVLLSFVVTWIALHRAFGKMRQLRAIAGGLAIEVRALTATIKGLELAYSDLADMVDGMMGPSQEPDVSTRINGAKACDVPADDQEMPF